MCDRLRRLALILFAVSDWLSWLMNKAPRDLITILLVFVLAVPTIAAALCTDPKTWVSGYHVPLEEELKTSKAIVLAKVVAKQKIFETPEDPEYYSLIYTVRIEETLKGDLPTEITIRDELTSAQYPMEVGERHLLFIRNWPWTIRGADYVIDSCGSSSVLPKGDRVVSRVAAALRETPRTP